MVAIGAAALSLEMVGRAWSSSGMAVLDFVNDRRISAHATKVNVAASYYVLFLPVAGALAWGGLSRIRSAATWAPRLIPVVAAVG